MNQPAAILWNKCILMRGAWQPQGHSTRAHLLLSSPPPAWLLHAAQIWLPTARDAAQGTGTHSGEHTQVISCVAPGQVLWNVFQGVTCVSLLEWGWEISWMLPVSSGLLVILWWVSCIHCLSPWKCWKSPSTSGQENALQTATVTLSLFL